MLQCDAACYSEAAAVAVIFALSGVLQCGAVCCSVLQCAAVCCSATHCNRVGGVQNFSAQSASTNKEKVLAACAGHTDDTFRMGS